MNVKMSTMDLLKRTWGVLKNDKSWLLHSIEVYVLELLHTFLLWLEIILHVILALVFIVLLHTTGSRILTWIIIGSLSFVVLIGHMVVSLLLMGVISGTLHTVIRKNLSGEKCDFFNAFKFG